MSQMEEQHEKILNVYHFRWFDLFAGILPHKSYQYVVKVMKMFLVHTEPQKHREDSHI